MLYACHNAASIPREGAVRRASFRRLGGTHRRPVGLAPPHQHSRSSGNLPRNRSRCPNAGAACLNQGQSATEAQKNRLIDPRQVVVYEMRIGTPGFQPKRLIEARDARALSQVALADLIGRTSSTVSRWESGVQLPEPEAIEQLARATNLPIAFFFKEPAPLTRTVFFRSMASTTPAIRRRVRARLGWACEISAQVQRFVELPQVQLPQVSNIDFRTISDAQIEEVADECRKLWGLGSGPISDVCLAVENAGVCVIREEVGSADMDGLSVWSDLDDRPYILIASDKQNCVRSRMDVAHELGHLILHKHVPERELSVKSSFKELERQAFLFASAFLLPARSFATEMWSPSLTYFVSLKQRWKVAISAMIMRCRQLHLISEEQQLRLWKAYSARGWRKSEPLDDTLEIERPRLLSRAIALVVDERVRSKSQIIDDLQLSARDVESLCNLPRGYMSGEEAEIVRLKMRDAKSKSADEGFEGTVVPFRKKEV